jgi:hypothetical protein
MKYIVGSLCLAVAMIVHAGDKSERSGGAQRGERSSPIAHTNTDANVERDFGNDRLAAGGTVRIDKPVAGDLLAAGGEVEQATTVAGDALISGGHIVVSKKVGQSLYAAAGKLFINDTVTRNARVVGGDVQFSPISEVGGNVSAAGGQVSLNGNVKGYVVVAGGRVFIDAIIGGDVEAASGQVELGPNARIAGKFRYASREPLIRDPLSQLNGGVESFEPRGGWPVPANVEHNMGRRGGWVWTAGLLLVAAVLITLLPNFYANVADTLKTHPGKSALIGFVTLICVPIAALLFLITIIGVPLGLLVIAVYLTLLLVGYVSTGISMGDWALHKVKSDKAGSTVWRITSAVVGVLVVSLLARIPWVGGWVVFVALLVGLGALAVQLWQLRDRKVIAS